MYDYENIESEGSKNLNIEMKFKWSFQQCILLIKNYVLIYLRLEIY